MPDGVPHGTIAGAAFGIVMLAALLFSALRHDSLYLLIGLACAIPIAIVLLAGSARRHRDRMHPSR